jgi:hypothetical protein
MAYWATVVPDHFAVVVTASADCPDTYGFTDFAIGHFPLAIDIREGAHDIITSRWKRLRDDGQERWAYLFGTGLISNRVATKWADEVWPLDNVAQDEEDEEVVD